MVDTLRPQVSPFPASTKTYLPGPRPDIRVPMREIALSPTNGRFGPEPNAPLRVYDTSGIYTDPEANPDDHPGGSPPWGDPPSASRCS